VAPNGIEVPSPMIQSGIAGLVEGAACIMQAMP
jgi:hypothetical protein